jgi:hypothetical protein
MPTFVASRLSGDDNSIFPDRLEIDDNNGNITYYKGTIVGYRQSFIARNNVASVRICSGLFFADIIIESAGSMQIRARGFSKGDARQIMNLLT